MPTLPSKLIIVRLIFWFGGGKPPPKEPYSLRLPNSTEPEVPAPYVRVEDNLIWWALGATIAVDAEIHWALGLSAVLEEQDGTKSYWALGHPNGDKPDFHDPACFAAHLP